MSESLFSDQWYRVSDTHPRLRAEVEVQRQNVRDQRWYLLVNTANGRQFRINEKAYELVGRLDGERSVKQAWEALLDALRDDAPTQDEVMETLNELDRQDLLAHDAEADPRAMVRRRDERQQQKVQRFVNPLALRVPLGDPSAWLARVPAVPRYAYNGWTLALWTIVALAGAIGAASHWPQLTLHAGEYMGSPRYLLLSWIAFPLLKAVHELAHAFAIRRWGGEVHEIGFTLFVLVPAPYVDASAAAAFAHRYQRFVVGAAGIMAELAIAAVALLVWLNVQPGIVRDFAFVTMFIASVSTVLFNGNPLLRFDAYYLACDAFNLPNLGPRSRSWWAGAVSRVLGGRKASAPMELAAGEAKWLVLYAPASLAMQIAVSWVIVLWLGTHSTLLAAFAGLVMFVLLVVKPLSGAARRVWAAAAPAGGRLRAGAVALAGAALVTIAVVAVPLPYYTVASGVVWPPEQARVRAGTDGFILELRARDGDRVVPGQVLAVLDDPALVAAHARVQNRLEQLHADRYGAMLQSPEQARRAEEEIFRAEAELARFAQRLSELEVRAQTAGTLSMSRQRDLPGTFVRQGATLAYVLERSEVAIRAAVPEYDAALVRDAMRSVEVRLAGARAAAAAELVRDIPAATYDLPSPALGDRGGGVHATDPADKDGLRTREPVVLIDLKVPASRVERLGATAWVRFDHGAQPLAQRWYRGLRQVFLQHLNPAG